MESELFAAVKRGVRVRLIAPVQVNGATPEVQQLQTDSLTALAAAGMHVHVSGPQESANYHICTPAQPLSTAVSRILAR